MTHDEINAIVACQSPSKKPPDVWLQASTATLLLIDMMRQTTKQRESSAVQNRRTRYLALQHRP